MRGLNPSCKLVTGRSLFEVVSDFIKRSAMCGKWQCIQQGGREVTSPWLLEVASASRLLNQLFSDFLRKPRYVHFQKSDFEVTSGRK